MDHVKRQDGFLSSKEYDVEDLIGQLEHSFNRKDATANCCISSKKQQVKAHKIQYSDTTDVSKLLEEFDASFEFVEPRNRSAEKVDSLNSDIKNGTSNGIKCPVVYLSGSLTTNSPVESEYDFKPNFT